MRKIRQATIQEAGILADLIQRANRPVAGMFNINRENTPTHPSFCTGEWIEQGVDRGETYFILEKDRFPVGCVACEFPEKSLAYLNRLAVLPEFQNQGMGRSLVDHIISLAADQGVKKLSIGIIAGHSTLRKWYEKIGFRVYEKKIFAHLVFDVLLMEYRIQ
ncbi:GNAT family N-acetyltransferase [Desulfospira joergensenii]|uniref:GNAT family N-acetyltransferase n=1 Tax=Desulfospira joergensenii TaxID=53329 RepID=UPI0003B7A1E0|nr:GNAT family N-acetyltransferase [Desulfospira joergensenii]